MACTSTAEHLDLPHGTGTLRATRMNCCRPTLSVLYGSGRGKRSTHLTLAQGQLSSGAATPLLPSLPAAAAWWGAFSRGCQHPTKHHTLLSCAWHVRGPSLSPLLPHGARAHPLPPVNHEANSENTFSFAGRAFSKFRTKLASEQLSDTVVAVAGEKRKATAPGDVQRTYKKLRVQEAAGNAVAPAAAALAAPPAAPAGACQTIVCD